MTPGARGMGPPFAGPPAGGGTPLGAIRGAPSPPFSQIAIIFDAAGAVAAHFLEAETLVAARPPLRTPHVSNYSD
jgi:hypothetical protein